MHVCSHPPHCSSLKCHKHHYSSPSLIHAPLQASSQESKKKVYLYLGMGSGQNFSEVQSLEKSCIPITAKMQMTITSTNVRFPRAPIVEMMILRRTFIVVQDRANFRTRSCNRTTSQSCLLERDSVAWQIITHISERNCFLHLLDRKVS